MFIHHKTALAKSHHCCRRENQLAMMAVCFGGKGESLEDKYPMIPHRRAALWPAAFEVMWRLSFPAPHRYLEVAYQGAI